MKTVYKGDSRYEKIYEQMQLLGIQDVSSPRQVKNGTIVWRLPIKDSWHKKYIEVAAFKSGYVRNQNSGYSNYQLNKRCIGEPRYYPEHKFVDGKQVETGKYYKFQARECILIPNEIDRLEYLIKYCVKNYYIKHANSVPNGEYVPQWKYEQAKGNADFHEKRSDEYMEKFARAKEVAPEMPNEVTVIIDGHRYKVI
jgi:hypothetical protein